MSNAYDVLEMFSPACRRWFAGCVGEPTPVQREGWPAIAQGGSVLIAAPTGTGKTLTAFLWAIDTLLERAQRGELEERVSVIYISPLKALGNDVRCNLSRPLEGIARELGRECPLRTAVRNGDTTPAERRAMLRKPPHILITTPESLYIMLTGESTRALLSRADTVIVDELHAVMDSKRGAHLMMSLERLNELCGRDVARIGLSATIKPLDTAAEYLAGFDAAGAPRPCRIVSPPILKRAELSVELALPDLRVMPEGSIWPAIFRRAYDEASACRTTLAFCEGRATAEKLAHGINELGGEGFARTHHGCISREQRLEAERQLKSGALRMMCATSSMELGIDVGEIDLVLQIGAPTSVARAAQRLGRAGHRPGEVSRMHFLPRTAQDILLDAFMARGVREGAIERTRPPRLCLDVAAQQLVAMSVTREYTVDEALGVLRGAWPTRALTRDMLEGLLRMLAGDYERDEDAPQRPRLIYDRINGVFRGDGYSRLLALQAGGTIPDRGYYGVYLEDGTYLGELDEEYVFEARLGDRFLLGAFSWQIVNITRDRVLVKPCDSGGAASPFWRGDGVGRPYDAGLLFGGYLRRIEEARSAGHLEEDLDGFCLDADARVNLARYIDEQAECGLPTDRAIICEHFRDEAGVYQLLVHSLFGSPVNLPLGLLLQQRAQQLTGSDVRMHYSDDGILLYSSSAPLPEGLLKGIDRAGARSEVIRLLPAAPLYSLAFRYNAGRSLCLGARAAGRTPLWVQRLRGEQAFARALRHEDHPMLYETMRECLEDYTDCAALCDVLEKVFTGEIGVTERHTAAPSPFARGLRGQLEAVEMYDYTPTPSAAGGFDLSQSPQLRLDAAALDAARAGEFGVTSADRLHELLLSRGDLVAGECDAPLEWLERLCAQGRALYVEPGLWIAAEDAELYAAALPMGEGAPRDAAALSRVVRRCLRWHGPMAVDDICFRYVLSCSEVEDVLRDLAESGIAVETVAGYVHRDTYERAQRIELRARRESIRTAPPESYAALLACARASSGAACERLLANLRPLMDLSLPMAGWETILPALTVGFKPRHIDQLIASGKVIWRVAPGKRPLLSFHDPERIDWDAAPEDAWREQELSADELTLLRALSARGASFISALPRPRDAGALEVLEGLCLRGLVVTDSLEPLRAHAAASPRRAARRTAAQVTSRRWELARPLKPLSAEQQLERAFERYLVVTRETAALCGVSWSEALNVLRAMEYTDRARRGYFVRGMSGAQFVRAGDFERVTLMLGQPRREYAALSAIDPLNPWGAPLKPAPGAAFMRVAGVAVVLYAGRPVVICEQQGRVLRVPEPEHAAGALAELARAFRAGQIYPALSRLEIADYPPECVPALEGAGFVREMLDYVVLK